MIKAQPFYLVVILLATLLLSSCDNTAVSDSQTVADLAWKPDGSGMFGLIERTTEASASVSQYHSYDLYRLGADGQVGEKLGLPAPAYDSYLLGVLMSADGQAALIGSATNIIREDFASNSKTVVLQNTYLLTASPDLSYVVTTTDNGYSPTKLCAIYDISHLPARRVAQFNAVNATNNRGVWLENSSFALTHLDSTQSPYITIYDTLGHAMRSIENAEMAFHASAYIAATHEIFVRDRLDHIVRIDLNSGQRHTVVPTSSVNSVDVSRDGKMIVYTTLDTNENRILRLENVETGDQRDIGTEAISVFLNPQATKLAYIHYVDPYNEDIRVMDVTLP
jgi:hypothetical protein